MKVINLIAEPGAGKSTNAAGTFFLMKTMGLNVECAHEYAKDLVWDRDFEKFKDQIGIYKEQRKRLSRLKGQVDFAITDSPLMFCASHGEFYNTLPSEKFKAEVMREFLSYDNINFFIERTKPYRGIGRNESIEDAAKLQKLILKYLEDYKIPVVRIKGDSKCPIVILDYLYVLGVIPQRCPLDIVPRTF